MGNEERGGEVLPYSLYLIHRHELIDFDEAERTTIESDDLLSLFREEHISKFQSPTPPATDLPLETSPIQAIPKSVLDSLDVAIGPTYALRQACATSLDDTITLMTRFKRRSGNEERKKLKFPGIAINYLD
jgi:hypothetical protein